MLPRLPPDYQRDGGLSNAETQTDIALLFPTRRAFTDQKDACVRQLSVAVALTDYSARPRAPLGDSVSDIIGLRPKKEVPARRVYAYRVVAVVQNAEPARYLALRNHPRDPVGEVSAPPYIDVSVPSSGESSLPFDTARQWIRASLRPKATDHVFCQNDVSHVDLRSGSLVRLGRDLKNRPEPFLF